MAQASFWEKNSFYSGQDIIIIGSGFVGLWSALQLNKRNPELNITVIDRGSIPTGASTRNAGFSCFGSPSELLTDAMLMGAEKMWKLVKMRYDGLQTIQQYFNPAQIGFDPSGGYECFLENSEDWQLTHEKLNWLNQGMKSITGVAETFRHDNQLLQQFGFKGFDHIIANDLEGGVQPGLLIQQLTQYVQQRGVQVLYSMAAESFVQDAHQVVLQMENGIRMTCKQLLLCTNAFTPDLIPEIDIVPCRGQVFITSPIPGLKMKGTFHFDKGYYYFRNVDNRLLIGGARNADFEGETTPEIAVTQHIQDELYRFVKRHLLPDTPFDITDRWSGIMAMGAEKMPLVHALGSNVFCCVRMSGMGVALAPVVADHVAELMLG